MAASSSTPTRRARHPACHAGPQNHLFAGSDGGGARWATVASLIGTCKLNDVEPHAYLSDVLHRMVESHPASRLDDLLPWNWKREGVKA
jgi:hypothetical protein